MFSECAPPDGCAYLWNILHVNGADRGSHMVGKSSGFPVLF
jgi:hypothetical protein